MGVPSTRQAAQGHHAGLPGGLRAQHHGQAAGGVRAVQPGPEGQDAEDRLSAAGG